MYLTTSRKPSLNTKRLCRVLARLFPRGIYENRGKKSVDDIAARARMLGKTRALIIYERSGNPDRIVFMSTSTDWEWLSPEITIKKLQKLPPVSRKRSGISLSGELAGKLSHLFNFEEPKGDEDSTLELGESEWSFHYGGKTVFSFGVQYA